MADAFHCQAVDSRAPCVGCVRATLCAQSKLACTDFVEYVADISELVTFSGDGSERQPRSVHFDMLYLTGEFAEFRKVSADDNGVQSRIANRHAALVRRGA